MIITLALLVFGLICIFLEFYMPGAIMGTIGAVMVISSVVVFATESTSPIVTIAYGIFVILILVYLIRYTIWRIPRTKPDYSIYLNSDQSGFQASSYDKNAIGKVGTVVADLKPGGYIIVDGKKQQAISQSGYISQGESVFVVSGNEESLIVKQIPHSDKE